MLNNSIKVAYLGPEGTFSQQAVIKHFGEQCRLQDCITIDDVFTAVENNTVQYGVVPVENSTEGAVNNTQDCLIDSSVKIVGEQVVSIEQHLLQKKGAGSTDIRAIASHKQSLAQCRKWLKSNYPALQQIECASNAEAAKLAQADGEIGAIAGKLAATIYDLNIVQSKIQDQQHNSTRFLVIANSATSSSGNDKTSILIYAENRPGALFRILEPFENLQVNLSKLEARPAKKEAWEYVFFIDFEGHIDDAKITELFSRLKRCTAEIKLLGSYPSSPN